MKRGRSDLEDSLVEEDLPSNKRLYDLTESMTTEEIVGLIKGLNSKMDSLNAAVIENGKTMKEIDQRLSSKFDNLESNMTASINQIKMEVVTRILSFTTDINDRFISLSSTTRSSCQETEKATKDLSARMELVHDLNDTRLHKLERDLLRNELIITGVPIISNENVSEIIGDICEAVNCNLSAGDVISAYRIPASKNKPLRKSIGRSQVLSSPIILKIVSDWGKNELLSAYFKKKNLNTKDIGFKSAARIYINESLTKFDRTIFSAASDAKKSKLIFKCYTRNGIVHIQTTEGGKIIRIVSLDQLNSLTLHSSSSLSSTTSTKQSKSTSSSTDRASESVSQKPLYSSSSILSHEKNFTADQTSPVNDKDSSHNGDMEQV